MLDELSHFGVPGMRWGRRKGSSDSSSSSDHTTSRNLKSKKLNEMSNDEIQTLAKRMQLEKQYKEALKADIHPGKKFAREILASAGKQVASKMLADVMTKAAKDLVRTAASKSKK